MIAFTSVPTPQLVSSSTGEPLPTVYSPGVVAIGTGDGTRVVGRVVTPDGVGLANVTVIATDTRDNRRLATTDSLGNFNFPYLTLIEPYIFSIQSKRYRFTPRVIQINNGRENFDFVGLR